MKRLLDELIAYIELDADDILRLADLGTRLEPHFARIADRFYAALMRAPSTARVLTGGEDQFRRLHGSLVHWMRSGLRGPYDEDFYQQRSLVGRRHVEVGLDQEYTFTAMNVVRTSYLEHIVELYPATEVAPVSRAANKLLDLELAIMVRHYQLDRDEQLLARERRAHADRMTALQTMTAGLAHEIRNPLNAAKLQLEVLTRRLQRADAAISLLDPVEHAMAEIARLSTLVNDFLAFAQPAELDLAEWDLAALVEEACAAMQPAAVARDATLAFERPSAPLRARVDRPKLFQVLENLLRNAIEAVPPGGAVRVDLGATADTVTIAVADTGAGIPEALRSRIFEPFFSTKDHGTGLGMAIVHSLVAMHCGGVDLDTGAGGTRVTVSLPCRR